MRDRSEGVALAPKENALKIFTVSPKASYLYGYDMDADGYKKIREFYRAELEKVLARGESVETYNGGMIGADMIFASVCADLRDAGADLSCTMFVPYANHDERWDEKNKRLFRSLASRMDEVRLNKEGFTKLSFFNRNNWFIAHANLCLSVTGRELGGEPLRVMNECLRRKVGVIRFADGKVSPYKAVKRLFVDAG